MTDAHKKAKKLMIDRGLTFRDMCKATGLKQTTVSNTLSGRTANDLTRQIITNFCGVRLWPNVPVTQRFVTIPAGTEMEYASEKEARECAAEELAAGIATQKGRIITIVRPATFIKDISKPDRSAKARNRHTSASSLE